MAKAPVRHVNVLARTSFAFCRGWPDAPHVQGEFSALGSLANCAVFHVHQAFKRA